MYVTLLSYALLLYGHEKIFIVCIYVCVYTGEREENTND